MNVRNVVKVMNFHSLLRVDSAKRTANKYQLMEEQLLDMIDGIVNNRNLSLDKKLLKVNENGPQLNLYLGSDFGFCSNFNSRINAEIREDRDCHKILIGKKLYPGGEGQVLFRMDSQEFREDMAKVREAIVAGINGMQYSRINIIYNHYVNTADIQLRRKQVYPVELQNARKNNDDFVVEGDIGRLLKDLIMSYVNYQVMLADVFSRAAENLMRQNATNDSLKRIDEIEEENKRLEMKERREKEFAKVIDSFVKMKSQKDSKQK